MLKGKNILLGISGSIAAYKSATLIRLLVKAGAEVKVIMTPSATDFIAPLTLSTLSKNEVLSELSENNSWSNHVMLGRWADLMVIAPLSCNTLAKMAAGLCDNLLMAVYLSAICPVIGAPAMDEDMWLHPSTKRNIRQIESYGNMVIPVENGDLASGLKGDGRMSEPENIVSFLKDYFLKSGQFSGKKILVTAGPTHEAIDPVRFIGNHSSGKMGIALAEEFSKRGATVTLVCGPVSEAINNKISLIKVTSAAEMYNACVDIFPGMDMAVMSAAVADYTIPDPSMHKIKKNGDSMTLTLRKTKDILKTLGENKKDGQLLVGFALETSNEKEHALKKLHEKNADMIILNSLNDPGAGFGHDTNKIVIFDKRGSEDHFDTKSKKAIASDIINSIIKFSNG
jgi:phosphopantothenoylcysteine decarboxylase/phosphopantothenate--cysteine ligase